MTDSVKQKTVNLEDLNAHSKVLFNKGIGNRGTCTTASATTAKEVTFGTTFSLTDGATALVRFTYGISAENATLAVTYTNASGSSVTTEAKAIYYRGAALPAGIVQAKDTLLLKYNGTQWDVVGLLDTTYENKLPASGGTDVSLVTTGEKFSWNAKPGQPIETTYSALKALRDNSQLVPGQWYRITDYVTTTVQTDTRSAGHAFDIIVFADEANKLNENAFAALHSGDTYFANSKLEAWELKYCLDNDTTRFPWADSTNGKGVIYWMKDERNIDAPYDFKNIQFKVCKVSDTHPTRTDINGKYLYFPSTTTTNTPAGVSVPDDSDYIWCYTFSSDETGGEQVDRSVAVLNIAFKNIHIGTEDGNIPYFVCFVKNDFICSSFLNTNYCVHSSSLSYFDSMTIEEELYSITLDMYDSYVLRFYRCSIGGGFRYNICGAMSQTSTGATFSMNNVVYSNQNTIGNNFRYNTAGTIQNSNIADNCRLNVFSGIVSDLVLDKTYFYENIIEQNRFLTITSNQTTSSSNKIQHIKVTQGVGGTDEGSRKTISHNTVNDTFMTEYRNSNSVVVNI